ncbi:MAG: DUF4097 family beta strand repeat-containing protein [Firmicutes bacterium]|nr:DUF4097 family beta strand repeat-containing protein [Bacillota bacterium]
MSLLTGGFLLAQAPPPPPPPPTPPPPPEVSLAGKTRTETKVEKLAMGAKLWVKNRNGFIRVEGWDREEVSISADIRDSDRRRIDLVVQRKGEDLDVEALFQQGSWGFNFNFSQSPRCEMTLRVPRKIQAHFRTTNGSVVVSGLAGYARCETTNGDIRVKDLSGEVHAETTNGTLEAHNLKARLKGETTNGRIVLEDVEGGIRAETTNGSIRARNLDGWGEGIRLETTNGSITVDLGRATGEVSAENANGTIDAKVPNAQVLESSKHSVRLKLPGHNQKIILETTNGGITVR